MSFSFLPVSFQPPSGGGGGGGGDLTAAQIKVLYESNANTNAYTNAEKEKLGLLPTADELISDLGNKVDKVAGSSLMTTSQAEKLAGIEVEATKNATDAQLRDRATHTGEQPISSVTGLESALAERVTVGDEKLTNAREWTAATVEQAEAEARTATTRRAWTAQRVGQAIAAWWATTGTAFGRAVVSWADAAAGRTALGLGTAATKAAQTGATDTTAGALMGVGAFGWGSTTPVPQIGASCLQAMTSSAMTLPGNVESGACLRMFSRSGAFTGLWTCAESGFAGRAWLLHTNDSWATQGVVEVFTSQSSSVISAKIALGVNKLESRTKATLPTAAANANQMYFCTDAAGGAAPVISNGTAWLAIQTTPLA